MPANKPIKYEYINALRGFAILLIIMVHCCIATLKSTTGFPETLSYILSKGTYGIQLFFIASSLTLFLSYNSRKKHEGARTNENFFIRRFFRVSPFYYLAAIIYSVACYYVPAYNDGKPLMIWKVLLNILYLNNLVPGATNYLPPGGWSIGLEILFYCTLPFLFKRIRNLKTAVIWFVIAAVGSFLLKLMIRFILTRMSIDYHAPENWYLYFWFPNQFPVFLLGIVLFFLLKTYSIKRRSVSYLIFILSTIMLCGFGYFIRDIDPSHTLPEHIILAIFFTINIFCIAQHSIKLLDNKFTCFMGEISFSLYLIHFLVIYLLADHFPLPVNAVPRFITLFVVTLLVSTPIAYFTYHFIEQKGIAIGDRLIHKKTVKGALNPGI